MRVVVLLAVLILSSTNLLSQELLRPSVMKQRAALEQPAQAKPIAQEANSLALQQKLDLLKRIQKPMSRIKELEKDRIGLPRKVRMGAKPLGRHRVVGPAKDAKPAQPAPAKTTQPGQLNTAESLLIDLTLVALNHPRWEDPSELKILGGFAVIKCSQSLGDGLGDLFAELSFYLSQE